MGNIVVQEQVPNGGLRDVVDDVKFAFAFRTFWPDGDITF
tara:strand:+ start:322 stop:441 length:120 start_codon:yes stop_codon:yes gene_type:complete